MAEHEEKAGRWSEKDGEWAEWRLVETVARTAHGAVELRYSPFQHLFKAFHTLHDGTSVPVELTLVESVFCCQEAENPTIVKRACLVFFARWKKEFALEYLAYSLEP